MGYEFILYIINIMTPRERIFSYKIEAEDKLSVFKILADIFGQPCRRDSVSSKRFSKP